MGLRAGATVVVAMSGGVDSATAALLLLEQGYRVIGVHMQLWREDVTVPSPAMERAQQVAGRLGIALHIVDLREHFRREVVDYVIAEYARGRTPNPCLACNRIIKFGYLLQEARRLGADALATGHYVRKGYWDGQWHLLRGVDRRKDQSYMLYMLGQAELAQLLFPLGELTKDDVRHIAQERGLPNADQPESQEICFIADNDYRRFLRAMAPNQFRPGPILDRAGRQIGQHHGLPFYTIGQRKGLGISAPEPLYVLALDVERNAIIAGPARELGRRHARVEHMSYVSGQVPAMPFLATAKIRYQALEAEVEVEPTGPYTAEVRFARKQRDITPGQGIVFYRDEEVLGGGIIASAW